MKDMNVLISDITSNLIELTGYEQAMDIKSVLYMHLSGCVLQEECTELSTGADDLKEALEFYWNEMQLRGYTAETMKTYGNNLKQFLVFVDKGLKDITENDIRRYMAYGRMQRKWKDSTYNTNMRTIRGFFKFCYEYDLIPEDPCKRLKDIREEKTMKSILTPEQREIIRCACRTERELALVDLLYSSGMRVSEVVKMNRSDIDFATRRAICYGKGRKQREIMFSPETSVHLKSYLNSRTDDNEALFVYMREPYDRLHKEGIQYLLRKIVKRDERLKNVTLTPHVYRRTRGTDLINRGMPAELVAQKFGHENVNTLLQCYAKIHNNTVWVAEEKCG